MSGTTSPVNFLITGLFHGLSFSVNDGFAVFLKHPLFCLLVGDVFKNVVIMIPSIWMKNDLLRISFILSIGHTNKADALLFDLSSVEETTDAEEAGVFKHSIYSAYYSYNYHNSQVDFSKIYHSQYHGEFKHEVRQFEKSYDNQQAEQISLMV